MWKKHKNAALSVVECMSGMSAEVFRPSEFSMWTEEFIARMTEGSARHVDCFPGTLRTACNKCHTAWDLSGSAATYGNLKPEETVLLYLLYPFATFCPAQGQIMIFVDWSKPLVSPGCTALQGSTGILRKKATDCKMKDSWGRACGKPRSLPQLFLPQIQACGRQQIHQTKLVHHRFTFQSANKASFESLAKFGCWTLSTCILPEQ